MSLFDRLVIALVVLIILFRVVALPATAVSGIFPSLASLLVGPSSARQRTIARLDNSRVRYRNSRQSLTCVAPGGRPVARFLGRLQAGLVYHVGLPIGPGPDIHELADA